MIRDLGSPETGCGGQLRSAKPTTAVAGCVFSGSCCQGQPLPVLLSHCQGGRLKLVPCRVSLPTQRSWVLGGLRNGFRHLGPGYSIPLLRLSSGCPSPRLWIPLSAKLLVGCATFTRSCRRFPFGNLAAWLQPMAQIHGDGDLLLFWCGLPPACPAWKKVDPVT